MSITTFCDYCGKTTATTNTRDNACRKCCTKYGLDPAGLPATKATKRDRIANDPELQAVVAKLMNYRAEAGMATEVAR
jgi:hypothetical protein